MNAPATATTLRVAPVLTLHPHVVQTYFQQMYMADTLKYRFSDIDDPTWSDALEVIQRMGQSMYMVMDVTPGQEDHPVAEFSLENFTGRSARTHFSTHPNASSPERVRAGRFGSHYTLTRKHPETGEYFFDSLYGLTPISNRAACIFAIKCGFKKTGVLPSGMMYLGQPEDCMISIATRETCHGW